MDYAVLQRWMEEHLPIVELLLKCLSDSRDTATLDRIGALTDSEWHTLLRQAFQQSINSLLFRYLRNLDDGVAIPENVIQSLRMSYLRNANRNMQFYSALADVLNSIQAQNIPVIVMKGAHLAEHVYDNIGLRYMNDLDILVHKSDMPAVEAALLDLGFQHHKNPAWYDKHHFHYIFTLPDTPVFLEVHWGTFFTHDKFKIELELMWETAQPARIAGVDTLVFSPEVLLIYLGLHNYYHEYYGALMRLYDLAAVFRLYQDRIDWSFFQQYALEHKLRKPLYVSYFFTKQWLQNGPPQDVMEALRPPDWNDQVVEWARLELLLGHTSPLLRSTNVAALWKSKHLTQKLAILLRSMFPSRSYLAKRYSVAEDSWRSYSLYLRHLHDIFRRHGNSLWSLIHHDQQVMVELERTSQWMALKQWMLEDDKRPGQQQT